MLYYFIVNTNGNIHVSFLYTKKEEKRGKLVGWQNFLLVLIEAI